MPFIEELRRFAREFDENDNEMYSALDFADWLALSLTVTPHDGETRQAGQYERWGSLQVAV